MCGLIESHVHVSQGYTVASTNLNESHNRVLIAIYGAFSRIVFHL